MRAADVLQVDQSLLQSSQCAEEMQVVNYQVRAYTRLCVIMRDYT